MFTINLWRISKKELSKQENDTLYCTAFIFITLIFSIFTFVFDIITLPLQVLFLIIWGLVKLFKG